MYHRTRLSYMYLISGSETIIRTLAEIKYIIFFYCSSVCVEETSIGQIWILYMFTRSNIIIRQRQMNGKSCWKTRFCGTFRSFVERSRVLGSSHQNILRYDERFGYERVWSMWEARAVPTNSKRTLGARKRHDRPCRIMGSRHIKKFFGWRR